jgi:hypothetical protein
MLVSLILCHLSEYQGSRTNKLILSHFIFSLMNRNSIGKINVSMVDASYPPEGLISPDPGARCEVECWLWKCRNLKVDIVADLEKGNLHARF